MMPVNTTIFSDKLLQQYHPKDCIDASGLNCPIPLLKLKQGLHHCESAEVLYIITTDQNSPTDIQRFCAKAGHVILHTELIEHQSHIMVKKQAN